MTQSSPIDQDVLRLFIERFCLKYKRNRWFCRVKYGPLLVLADIDYQTFSKLWLVPVLEHAPTHQITAHHADLIRKHHRVLTYLVSLYAPRASPSLTEEEIRILSRAGVHGLKL